MLVSSQHSDESPRSGHIGGGPIEDFERFYRAPSELGVLGCDWFARRDSRDVRLKGHSCEWVRMRRRFKMGNQVNLDAEFLPNFTQKRGRRVLTGLNLAAGELP